LDEKQIAVTIVNNSHNGNALREGRFEIYYESKNGTRMPVPSVSIQGNGLPLAPGESINLIFDYPDDVDETIEQPYMVVFNGLEGAIGREYGLTSARFPQPVTGTVFNFFLESPDCPAKRFVVIIIFEKQPENNGQVVLMGNDSGARFDFRNIPPGDITINNVLWTHNVRLSKGEYEYQVAITPAGFSGKVCDTPSVGPWIAGEKVIPLNPFIDEL
jgi:hypothetical protein